MPDLASTEFNDKVNAEFIIRMIGVFREFSVHDL
jgi:hypothetical protein